MVIIFFIKLITIGKCCELADEIKENLGKQFGFKNYRFLVQVILGEQNGQGIKVASRCFWENNKDAFVDVSYVSENLFCIVLVFRIFYE